VGRWLRDYVDAVDINMIRWLIALAVLLPFGWRVLHRERAIIIEHLPLVLTLGILGVALFQTLLYIAFQTTTAINAVLILSTCPVFIALGNGIFNKEWIAKIAALGIAVSLCGALVLISHGQLSTLQQLNFYPGDLWMLLASFIWAMYSIALKRRPPTLSQTSLLLSTIIIGLVILVPWSLINSSTHALSGLTLKVYGGLLYLGVFASVLAFMCWNRGVELVGSNKAGIFLHLIPAFTAVLSFLLLNEGLTYYHIVGAALIFGGIILTTRNKRHSIVK
jgi:drug/metabolite transporter (DMT)-like permease